MLKPSLLNALRKATSISIAVDPSVIELIPTVKVKGQGGIVTTLPDSEVTPREPQVFTVESVGATLQGISGTSGGSVQTQGAQAHSWSFNLHGSFDCEMEIGDHWVEDGTTYRVEAIQPANGYERVGVVSAFGADPKYGA